MSILYFEYILRDDFTAAITDHYFTLKCCPADTKRQKILELEICINPYEDVCRSRDAFGNLILTGHQLASHRDFEVKMSGYANTGLSIFEAKQTEVPLIYTIQSEFTIPGKSLETYYADLELDRLEKGYDKVLFITKNLYKDYSYKKNITNIYTKAEEAFQLKEGVCQDYTHILLALCRMAGIPCRYVVGIIIGEGESHAWVEFYANGYWYGIDPTNNLLVNDDYIRISGGRDYCDCIISRGIYKGTVSSQQNIHAQVVKITD